MSKLNYATHEMLGGSRLSSGQDVAEANRRAVQQAVPDAQDWAKAGPAVMELAVASAAAGKPNAFAALVAKDNPKVVLEEYAFGGFQLWLRNDIGAEIIRKLDSYPLLDEGVQSEVESEMERDSFDSWMRRELVERAVKEYAAQGGDAEKLADEAAELDNETLWGLYLEAKGEVGAQYLVEGGGNTLDGMDRTASAMLSKLVEETARTASRRP